MLDAIARALRLDDTERDHLLALAASASPAGEAAAPQHPRHDGATGAAVHPRRDHRRACAGPHDRLDIIAANSLGRALPVAAYANPRRPVNLAGRCFLDRDSAERLYPDWDNAADAIVAIPRAEAGRDP